MLNLKNDARDDTAGDGLRGGLPLLFDYAQLMSA